MTGPHLPLAGVLADPWKKEPPPDGSIAARVETIIKAAEEEQMRGEVLLDGLRRAVGEMKARETTGGI